MEEGEADSKSASNESDEAEDDEDAAETADDGEKKMSSTLLAVLATAAFAVLMATPIGNPCACGNRKSTHNTQTNDGFKKCHKTKDESEKEKRTHSSY